jgi:hypothetical protein
MGIVPTRFQEEKKGHQFQMISLRSGTIRAGAGGRASSGRERESIITFLIPPTERYIRRLWWGCEPIDLKKFEDSKKISYHSFIRI